MSLLKKYEDMLVKEAEEAKAAEAIVEEETEKIASAEELEVIEKYASAADDLLSRDYGTDYTEDDVVELATMLINHDQAEAEEAVKVASLEEAGRVIAKSFLQEISKAG